MRKAFARVTTTGVPVGLTLDLSGFNQAVMGWSIQCFGVGASVTSHTTVVQVSCDGVNWHTISTHNATTATVVSSVWGTTSTPFVRVNVTALTLGSATALDIHLCASLSRGM
jgi:hypothetical protein